MTASQILDAIARKHARCALVREIVIRDDRAWDEFEAALAARTPDTSPWDIPRPVHTRRIDGLLFNGSGTRTSIEVKLTHHDFLRETHSKRAAWRRVTHRFVYAAPPGVIAAAEVPTGCGLWIVDGHQVRVAVRARINRSPDRLPYGVTVALAYRLQDQIATNQLREASDG